MGRPTMEGYWWSGKFWRDEVSGRKSQARIGGMDDIPGQHIRL